MILIDKNEFLRSFAVRPNGALNFFLGAGASIQANIPVAGTLIWQFKRMLYCQANSVREEKFKDLESEKNRNMIQSFFDIQGNYPKNYNSEEYSFYFEKCYPNSIDRKSFIQKIVQGKNPSIGHKCLGTMFDNQKVNHIWTTNFDELIENGIKNINNSSSFETISPEITKQLGNLNKYSRVIKLHGDYRYDKLQNTSKELQSLEQGLHKYFAKIQIESGLIVIGYGGNDKSVLDAFNETLNYAKPFPYGLYWCIRKGQKPNQTIIELIEKVNDKNKEKLSGFIEIESFDEFLFELYVSSGIKNADIDTIAETQFEKRRPFASPQSSKIFPPLKLNGIKAKKYPTSVYSFKTNLEGWKELREFIKGKSIQAALSKGNTLAFGNIDEIKQTFEGRIQTEIITTDIDVNLTYKQDSFYTGLLYDLIEQNLVNNYSLTKVRTYSFRKYYSTKHPVSKEELKRINFQLKEIPYEAFEIKIEFHNQELFIILLPTIYIDENSKLDRKDKQYICNRIVSSRYNKNINESLKFWLAFLKNSNESIEFSNFSFKIELEGNYCSAGIDVSKFHIFKGAFQSNEPRLVFHISDKNYSTIHPLKGLKDFGPLDYSFENKESNPQSIKVGIISTETGFSAILKHLDGLNEEIKAKSEKEYLIDYLPFSTIYKKYLEIPHNKDNRLVELLNEKEVIGFSHSEFYDFLKRKIDYFYTLRGGYDVLVIYFPTSLSKFRELKNESIYFDLHDSIKLYCAKNNIKIQFIEDKSIQYFDQAKVRWWLSLGLYVKSNGTPWRNQIIDDSTAFIGLDFAVRNIKSQSKYVLGSSQIFDSSGQGLRFLLQPIEHPVFYGRNPFMSKEDARRLILKLKEAYFNLDGTSKLSKLVVHKVMHFTYDEMQGISEALEGIENFELLQIQKYPNWRAIRGNLNRNTNKLEVYGFPVKRGTVIQLDDFSFLLWTHGSVQDDEVAGRYMNFYQGKRGIPSPLLIRRFRGTDPIETTVREILSLTKMNWNGGELYKSIPVTLDFSKRLSKYAKQAESLPPRAFDFRFFM